MTGDKMSFREIRIGATGGRGVKVACGYTKRVESIRAMRFWGCKPKPPKIPSPQI
jgi:hypothetical protein